MRQRNSRSPSSEPGFARLEALADEVVDLARSGDGWPWRSMRPLRCSSRVGRERDLHVDHAVAVALQVDALAGGVGGEQDPDRRAIGRRLELGLDALALVDRPCRRRAARRARRLEPVADEQVLQPALRVAVLGEDDDPLVVPARRQARHGLVQPVEQRLGLGVGPMRPRARPTSSMPASSACSSVDSGSTARAAVASASCVRSSSASSASTSSSSRVELGCAAGSRTTVLGGAAPAERAHVLARASRANAAGDENRRFLSSSVTKSVAVWTTSSRRACGAASVYSRERVVDLRARRPGTSTAQRHDRAARRTAASRRGAAAAPCAARTSAGAPGPALAPRRDGFTPRANRCGSSSSSSAVKLSV